MIIACTGPRPQNCDCNIIPNPIYNKICSEIESKLIELKPEKVITGLAIGVDSWFANIAFKLKIPFIAAIPFLGQENLWNIKDKAIYNKLLNRSCEKVIVSSGGFSSLKFQLRNEYMVDNCDILLAIINKSTNSGGTFNCVNYAKSVKKPIIFIDPNIK